MAGRPRKPPQLKVIAGTTRPDRESAPQIALPTVSESPPAPDWLPNIHAVKEWERLTGILIANGLLTEGGLSALAMLCALHGKIVQLLMAGETPKPSMVGTLRSMMNDFGLSPVASGKVRPAGAAKSRNKFSNNGSRSG